MYNCFSCGSEILLDNAADLSFCSEGCQLDYCGEPERCCNCDKVLDHDGDFCSDFCKKDYQQALIDVYIYDQYNPRQDEVEPVIRMSDYQ